MAVRNSGVQIHMGKEDNGQNSGREQAEGTKGRNSLSLVVGTRYGGLHRRKARDWILLCKELLGRTGRVFDERRKKVQCVLQ